jgi:hypothetical protein
VMPNEEISCHVPPETIEFRQRLYCVLISWRLPHSGLVVRVFP